MSKSMMGSAGGGKVTVEGLVADVVMADKEVKVLQGTKEVFSVVGKLRILSCGGCKNNPDNDNTIYWNGKNYVQTYNNSHTFEGTPLFAVCWGNVNVGGNMGTESGVRTFTSFTTKAVSSTGYHTAWAVIGY